MEMLHYQVILVYYSVMAANCTQSYNTVLVLALLMLVVMTEYYPDNNINIILGQCTSDHDPTNIVISVLAYIIINFTYQGCLTQPAVSKLTFSRY